MKTLVVESPTKAKTIGKYLGKDFKVVSSYGHVRDLLSKDGSVNPDDNFKMVWEIAAKSKAHIKAIQDAIKTSDTVLLATDPDREGEAIAWHVSEILKKDLKGKTVARVVFHEITKNAIEEAIKSPRNINQELVQAYLARRALDYLFGFTLSPILWRKLPGARSAGRVQSVALRLIVEREEEIEAFKTTEYWDINGVFAPDIEAKLIQYNKEKLEKFSITNDKQANDIEKSLADLTYRVEDIDSKKVQRNPLPPYITSTLQQDGANKFGFSASKTMKIAQQLYEGISITGEVTGLITYMRTDSVSMSNDAIDKIRQYIKDHFKADYLPKEARGYKSKVKNAQEAHECIRPSLPNLSPKDLKNKLDEDQFKIYSLIWNRSIASQMSNAEFLQTKVDIVSADNQHIFRANGQICQFEGFLAIYGVQEGDDIKMLPVMKKGQDMLLKQLTADQHFTQPPARFNEGSLIKKLEELGIGRPSTYASMIEVLKGRNYVILEKRRFTPDMIGRFVVLFLRKYFPTYIEYDFTAQMEENLDTISSGGADWQKVLTEFWTDFSKNVTDTLPLRITEVINYLESHIGPILFQNYPDHKCPDCVIGEVHLKLSKFGAFIGCSRYPDCTYTKNIKEVMIQEDGEAKPVFEKIPDKPLGKNEGIVFTLKKGPYGFYIQGQKEKSTKKDKPKNMKLPNFVEPEEATLQHAIFLYSLPRSIGDLDGESILLGVGRFGPFLKWKTTNFSLPKGTNFFELSAVEAKEIIEKKLSNPTTTSATTGKKRFTKSPR